MKNRIIRPLIMTIILVVYFSMLGCAVGVGERYPNYYGPDYDYPYYGPSPYPPRFYEHNRSGHEHEEHRDQKHEEHREHEHEEHRG